MRRRRRKSYRRASRPSGRLFIPIGDGGCPSRNPSRSPPAPWRAPGGTSSPPAARDHLHVCGEQHGRTYALPMMSGSSPRVRGAGVDVVAVVLLGGIIPARAGSSRCRILHTRASGDHPRACGEQRSQLPAVLMSTESSPRMRGAGGQRLGAADTEGIIPAHAGSSPAAGRRHRCGRDHPRVCGEQTLRQQDAEAYVGSSPRVRGAGCAGPHGLHRLGIIPACAGSSA